MYDSLNKGLLFLILSFSSLSFVYFLSIGPGDRGLIPGRVIPKNQKIVLDAALLSTQHYKVRTKSKVKQSWKLSSALGSLSTKVANLQHIFTNVCRTDAILHPPGPVNSSVTGKLQNNFV